MILVLVGGFLFDIVGRRITMLGAFLLAGASALLMPFTAPSVYPGLLLVRMIFAVSVMPIMANTFINDYIT